MSYLVNDIEADYTDRSTGNRQVRAFIVADTAADLPVNTTALTWLLGSHAKTVDTGDEYWIDSSGSWILQPSSAITGNYYTKTETEGRLSAHVCQCDTAGNVADKVATTSDDFVLREGAIIAVKFDNNNTVTDIAAHPITLNVNNTGAYRIFYSTGAYQSSANVRAFGYAGYYIYYVFADNKWVWINVSALLTYTTMTQAQATAGTDTVGRLITAKVLHDTIIEQTNPLKTSLISQINSGGKNALHFDVLSAGSVNGLTFAINSDFSVTVSGTQTNPNNASFAFLRLGSDTPYYIDDLCNGNYFLSGCPSGGSDSTYRMYAAKGSYVEYDYGSGVLLESTAETGIQLVIWIAPNYTIDTALTFYPMIDLKTDHDISPTYEPYCPTLSELYALVRSYHP